MSIPYITEEEYLEQERKAWWVGDYFQGRIYPAEAASGPHGQIVANLIMTIGPPALQRGCTIFDRSTLVRIKETGLYTHPDVTIVCGAVQYSDVRRRSMILNPTVIIEVASPTTEDYDAGGKFAQYCRLPSLKEYFTVQRDEASATRYLRQPGDEWLLREFRGLESVLPIRTLDVEIPLASIYQTVEFPEAPLILQSWPSSTSSPPA